ncbi:MAG TPA: hypothetical protein PLM34_07710, partial [Lentimicrobium sp.]|nr:hypothetical protein [Lentimicrobium sp.]
MSLTKRGMIHENNANDNQLCTMSLIQNYLKTAVRNLVRLRIHSIINISGLAIGLSCFFIIMLYVDD